MTTAPAHFRGAKTVEFERLAPVSARLETAHGEYVQAVDTTGPHRLWRINDGAAAADAFLVPFDDNFSARLRSLQRLHQRLTGSSSSTLLAASQLSPAQRGRLTLFVRALDGKQAGASHREIAAVLLDRQATSIPAIEWTNAPLRKRINRIIQSAQVMVKGGYLKLLRGDIERAGRFHRRSR